MDDANWSCGAINSGLVGLTLHASAPGVAVGVAVTIGVLVTVGVNVGALVGVLVGIGVSVGGGIRLSGTFNNVPGSPSKLNVSNKSACPIPVCANKYPLLATVARPTRTLPCCVNASKKPRSK